MATTTNTETRGAETGAAIVLHAGLDAGDGLPPDWLDFAPADADNAHPSVRVFVDSMEYPAPALRFTGDVSRDFYPPGHLPKGRYVYVEPTRDVPFSDVYLFRAHGSGLLFGRLTPWLHGAVKVQFAHPDYEGFTMLSHMRDRLEVLARVVREQPDFRNPHLERHPNGIGHRRRADW